jgi:hypothetical protein
MTKNFGLIDWVALIALVLGAGVAITGITVAPGTSADAYMFVGGLVVGIMGLARLFRFVRT